MDNHSKNEAFLAAFTQALGDEGSPDGISVIVYMRPERVHGVTAGESKQKDGALAGVGVPSGGIRKTYKTSSFYFASEFLDRLAELSTSACAGLRVRPVQVELTFELDEKALRNVGLILDSVDNAFRAL